MPGIVRVRVITHQTWPVSCRGVGVNHLNLHVRGNFRYARLIPRLIPDRGVIFLDDDRLHPELFDDGHNAASVGGEYGNRNRVIGIIDLERDKHEAGLWLQTDEGQRGAFMRRHTARRQRNP